MFKRKCPKCDYVAEKETEGLAAIALNMHSLRKHRKMGTQTGQKTGKRKAKKSASKSLEARYTLLVEDLGKRLWLEGLGNDNSGLVKDLLNRLLQEL